MPRRPLAIAILAIVIAPIAAACATGSTPPDPCKRALERLVDECGFEASGVDTLDTHCSGQSECIANCLETSPCDDINHNNGEFAACTADCQ